jgi:polyvinyl alcohol dehydrogenase (cytochrome)
LNRIRDIAVRGFWLGSLWSVLNLTPATLLADGASVYAQRCAACHDQALERAPSRDALRNMSPEMIAMALSAGLMQSQAAGLGGEDIRAVAVFLSGKNFGASAEPEPQPNPCHKASSRLQLKATDWNGWGRDVENSRYQPRPGLKATDVPRLKLKWAYTYPGRAATGHPTIIGDKLFVTSSTGRISMLNVRSGCEYWTYEAGSGVRSAITIAPLPRTSGAKFAAYFGDQKTFAHAIDAQTGAPLWKTKLDEHPVARITGSPQFFEGQLYVPLSSVEEVASRDAGYQCCTFRGSVAALDGVSGKVLWKTYTIDSEPKPFRKSSAGTQMFGPAGAAIWSTPTIDVKRRVLYVGTGNSYTDVATNGSDAVQALSLDAGERRWINQLTPNDAYLVGCGKDRTGIDNCPQTNGPDFDIGSPPILRTLPDGKQILLVGQKSGVVYGLDPQEGKTLWQTRVGSGSSLGGVEWGMSADTELVYAPNSDFRLQATAQPGITALKFATGEKVWSVPAPNVECRWDKTRCIHAQSAPATVIPGVVFSGAYDGHMRAYAAKDGAIVWDYDTAQAFDTVNGLKSSGGSIDLSGVTLANGYLFVISGSGGRLQSGRVLLAFTVNGK